LNVRWVAAAVLFILAGVAPFLNDYLLHIVIMALLYSYLGTCWNILGGYAGQFSFGHTAYFGIGAYVSTILLFHWQISPWIGMICGAFTGLLFGLFIGFLCFRYGLKGPYFALATLAFAEMLRIGALNLDITGKAMGMLIPLEGNSFRLFQFTSKLPYYYIILSMAAAVVLINHCISNAKLGDCFEAVREDPDSAMALGIDTFKYKMIAMAISSFFTAMAGTFYAQYMFYIDPDICFGVQNSVEIFLRPIVGGLGTVLGPTLGAFLLAPISEITRNLLGSYSGLYLMIYGILFIMVIVFFPKGIVGLLKSISKEKHRGLFLKGA
jgi:branched-chain amino acid transport system permease protein